MIAWLRDTYLGHQFLISSFGFLSGMVIWALYSGVLSDDDHVDRGDK